MYEISAGVGPLGKKSSVDSSVVHQHHSGGVKELRYRSNVMSHSLACIFLESRYSILFSLQVLAQILRESRLMLRTRLVELDHSREFRFAGRSSD